MENRISTVTFESLRIVIAAVEIEQSTMLKDGKNEKVSLHNTPSTMVRCRPLERGRDCPQRVTIVVSDHRVIQTEHWKTE